MACVDIIETADGRRLALRAVDPGDAAGLFALYAALSPEDRHPRFFSLHALSEEDADVFARVAEHGRFGVVAVDEATGNIVGDGRCTPDGDVTDMAVAVRGDYQGTGVGRALRDALSAEARARGIDTLVADILCDNQRMHRVLQSLPHVIVDRPDERVVRVAYRTDGSCGRPVSTWPSAPAPTDFGDARVPCWSTARARSWMKPTPSCSRCRSTTRLVASCWRPTAPEPTATRSSGHGRGKRRLAPE
jgi:GNAT superfamily N-acetyltransferase